MIVYVEFVSLPEAVFVYLYLCVCEFVSLPEAVFVLPSHHELGEEKLNEKRVGGRKEEILGKYKQKTL